MSGPCPLCVAHDIVQQRKLAAGMIEGEVITKAEEGEHVLRAIFSGLDTDVDHLKQVAGLDVMASLSMLPRMIEGGVSVEAALGSAMLTLFMEGVAVGLHAAEEARRADAS